MTLGDWSDPLDPDAEAQMVYRQLLLGRDQLRCASPLGSTSRDPLGRRGPGDLGGRPLWVPMLLHPRHQRHRHSSHKTLVPRACYMTSARAHPLLALRSLLFSEGHLSPPIVGWALKLACLHQIHLLVVCP